MMTARLPERVQLARLPTPVERLGRLSAALGVTILVKRDDLTGMPLSGNKVRKLEYVLGEARRLDATDVITTGGIQSNHCRATTLACRKLGIVPHLLLRTSDGQPPSELDGNHLLDALAGAEMRYVTSSEYTTRDIFLARWADELSAADKRPYVVPEGASTALGALGYVSMVEEFRAQLDAGAVPGGDAPDFVVCPSGTGGTAAGLVAGIATETLGTQEAPPRVVTYAVCDNEAFFRERIGGILEDLAAGYMPDLDPAAVELDVVDAFVGEGYGLSTPEELGFLAEIARTEALLLDPVYTGKAFRGLVEEIRQGERYPQGSTILFVHTGGLFGLFPKRIELTSALSEILKP